MPWAGWVPPKNQKSSISPAESQFTWSETGGGIGRQSPTILTFPVMSIPGPSASPDKAYWPTAASSGAVYGGYRPVSAQGKVAAQLAG